MQEIRFDQDMLAMLQLQKKKRIAILDDVTIKS